MSWLTARRREIEGLLLQCALDLDIPKRLIHSKLEAREHRTYLMLSFCGGGARAYNHYGGLKRYGFDQHLSAVSCVCGVSAGSFVAAQIALVICKRKRVEDISQEFRELFTKALIPFRNRKVFEGSDQMWSILQQHFSNAYDNISTTKHNVMNMYDIFRGKSLMSTEQKCALLREAFGDLTLGDIPSFSEGGVDVLIAIYNVSNATMEIISNIPSDGYLSTTIAEAISQSSAVPLLFDGGANNHYDGALWSNQPTERFLEHLLRKNPNMECDNDDIVRRVIVDVEKQRKGPKHLLDVDSSVLDIDSCVLDPFVVEFDFGYDDIHSMSSPEMWTFQEWIRENQLLNVMFDVSKRKSIQRTRELIGAERTLRISCTHPIDHQSANPLFDVSIFDRGEPNIVDDGFFVLKFVRNGQMKRSKVALQWELHYDEFEHEMQMRLRAQTQNSQSQKDDVCEGDAQRQYSQTQYSQSQNGNLQTQNSQSQNGNSQSQDGGGSSQSQKGDVHEGDEQTTIQMQYRFMPEYITTVDLEVYIHSALCRHQSCPNQTCSDHLITEALCDIMSSVDHHPLLSIVSLVEIHSVGMGAFNFNRVLESP